MEDTKNQSIRAADRSAVLPFAVGNYVIYTGKPAQIIQVLDVDGDNCNSQQVVVQLVSPDSGQAIMDLPAYLVKWKEMRNPKLSDRFPFYENLSKANKIARCRKNDARDDGDMHKWDQHPILRLSFFSGTTTNTTTNKNKNKNTTALKVPPPINIIFFQDNVAVTMNSNSRHAKNEIESISSSHAYARIKTAEPTPSVENNDCYWDQKFFDKADTKPSGAIVPRFSMKSNNNQVARRRVHGRSKTSMVHRAVLQDPVVMPKNGNNNNNVGAFKIATTARTSAQVLRDARYKAKSEFRKGNAQQTKRQSTGVGWMLPADGVARVQQHTAEIARHRQEIIGIDDSDDWDKADGIGHGSAFFNADHPTKTQRTDKNNFEDNRRLAADRSGSNIVHLDEIFDCNKHVIDLCSLSDSDDEVEIIEAPSAIMRKRLTDLDDRKRRMRASRKIAKEHKKKRKKKEHQLRHVAPVSKHDAFGSNGYDKDEPPEMVSPTLCFRLYSNITPCILTKVSTKRHATLQCIDFAMQKQSWDYCTSSLLDLARLDLSLLESDQSDSDSESSTASDTPSHDILMLEPLQAMWTNRETELFHKHDLDKAFNLKEFRAMWAMSEGGVGEITYYIERNYFRGKVQHDKQYGRILPLGMKRIFKFVQEKNRKYRKCFLDIGHGIGNTCLQAAYTFGWDARGIEILKDSNEWAKKFQKKLEELFAIHEKRGSTFKPGKVELKVGNLLDPNLKTFLVEGVDVVFFNNFNGVFSGERGAANIDRHVAGLFGLMKPGTIMITLHRLMSDIGLSDEETEEYRQKRNLPMGNADSSFFKYQRVNLGKRHETTSWSEGNRSIKEDLFGHVYTRLEQARFGRPAMKYCNNNQCPLAKGCIPFEAVTYDEQNSAPVIASCTLCNVRDKIPRKLN